MIHIIKFGRCATAGSKKAFPFRKKDGTLGVRVTHDNELFYSFSRELRDVALAECHSHRDPIEGPVYFGLVVVRSRPKSHYRSGRYAGELKQDAPAVPITKPDNTKTRRAVEDALTGVVWKDDSQIVVGVDAKVYGAPERIEVFVSTECINEVLVAVESAIERARDD